MARTPQIEISVDSVVTQPEWMSSTDYYMLLHRFGMEPRVTYYTCNSTSTIRPIDLAYQCASAWADLWTIQYDNWLYYGSSPDDDYVDTSEWMSEVKSYNASMVTDYESTPNEFWDELDCKIHESLAPQQFPKWRRDKRAYARTAAQSRRDKSVHARGRRSDDGGVCSPEEVITSRVRAFMSAMVDDTEQDVSLHHERELYEQFPGLKRIWKDGFLDRMRRKLQLGQRLTFWERLTLERFGVIEWQLEVDGDRWDTEDRFYPDTTYDTDVDMDHEIDFGSRYCKGCEDCTEQPMNDERYDYDWDDLLV